MSSFKHLTTRLLFVVPIILALIFLVAFSHLIFMKFIVLGVMLVFINFAVYEFSYLLKALGNVTSPIYLSIFSTFFIIAHFFGQLFCQQTLFLPLMFIFLICSFCVSFYLIKGGVNYVSYSLFSLIYLVLPLCFLGDILLFFKGIDNKIWFAFLLVVTKFSDIGGYFFGKLIGKRPMAKRLSPKKTVEGAFFGLLFSVCASVCFKLIITSLGYKTFTQYSLLFMIVLGFIMGCLAILGDLSESLIKRDASIKHSSPLSNIGGVLDLFDSLVFCIPFVYFYLVYFI